MRKLSIVLALIALVILSGCGFLKEQVTPRVQEGLLRLDTEVQMARATGEALVEAPETVSDAEKKQFRERLKLVNDITYILNVLVGNYDMSGLLEGVSADPAADAVIE